MRRFAGFATAAALSILAGSGVAAVAAAPAQAAQPQDATACSQVLATGGFSGSTGFDQKLIDKACGVASQLGAYPAFESTLQELGVWNQDLIRRAYQAARP